MYAMVCPTCILKSPYEATAEVASEDHLGYSEQIPTDKTSFEQRNLTDRESNRKQDNKTLNEVIGYSFDFTEVKMTFDASKTPRFVPVANNILR